MSYVKLPYLMASVPVNILLEMNREGSGEREDRESCRRQGGQCSRGGRVCAPVTLSK